MTSRDISVDIVSAQTKKQKAAKHDGAKARSPKRALVRLHARTSCTKLHRDQARLVPILSTSCKSIKKTADQCKAQASIDAGTERLRCLELAHVLRTSMKVFFTLIAH